MGILIDGQWQDTWYPTEETKGRFVRSAAQFRNWITADGSAGPSGRAGFKAEVNRYHLYVSYACPWANRTLIFRKIKGLKKIISLSVVHWHMADEGWTFADGEGVIKDTENNADFLRDIYLKANNIYSGRVTVPVLWDKKPTRLFPMNLQKLFVCSIVPLMQVAQSMGIIILLIYVKKLIGSMYVFTIRSTMEFIRPVLPQLRKPMRKRLYLYLKLWIGWNRGWRQNAT
tara:strand:- start:5 stop:691 length:687 start_codon:yes stop_codon:yes gene_type:complete